MLSTPTLQSATPLSGGTAVSVNTAAVVLESLPAAQWSGQIDDNNHMGGDVATVACPVPVAATDRFTVALSSPAPLPTAAREAHLVSPAAPSRRGRDRRGSDAGRATRQRRSSARWNDRLGLCLSRPMMRGAAAVLEREFQAETLVEDVRFARSAALLGLPVLLAFLADDCIKYPGAGPVAMGVWRDVALIRYAGMVPILLAFVAATRTRIFVKSWAFRQSITCGASLALGLGVVAITFVGLSPGYGILSVYLVLLLNFGVLALALRVLTLAILVAVYIGVAVMVTGVTAGDIAVPLAFLAAFTMGEAVPVVLREHAVRQNYFRRVYIEVERRRLTDERARTDRLLCNLLPPVIVPRLRAADRGLIADEFDDVTVLWTDIKGFTAFSAARSPLEVVAFLNAMFSTFDRILDKYGVRKVEVLGDAFFVVGGCPVVCDDHAERCANAALEMLDHLPILRRFAGTDALDMRVGLHTGPVMAGVVGSKDPRYHLFGATVPYANAMESLGEPGRVHVSATTHAKLRRRQQERAAAFVRACGGEISDMSDDTRTSSEGLYCQVETALLDRWYQSQMGGNVAMERATALRLEQISAVAAAAAAASSASGNDGNAVNLTQRGVTAEIMSVLMHPSLGRGSDIGLGSRTSDTLYADRIPRLAHLSNTTPPPLSRTGRGYFSRAFDVALTRLVEIGPGRARGQVQVWQGSAFLGWDILANTRASNILYAQLPRIGAGRTGKQNESPEADASEDDVETLLQSVPALSTAQSSSTSAVAAVAAAAGLFPTCDPLDVFSVAAGFFAFEERAIELRGVPGQTTYFLRRADPPYVPALDAKLVALQRALKVWEQTVGIAV